jgi:uncharacterized membrane protein
MLMKDYTLVLAVFSDETTADSAAEALKESGLAPHEAIGVLALDDKGEVKTEKIGKRSLGKGAGIGLALAMLTPVGLGVGLVGGGLLGALHHKGLGLNNDERERLGAELSDGKAAVGVLTQVGGAADVSARLTELGGTAELHNITDDDLEEARLAAASDAP